MLLLAIAMATQAVLPQAGEIPPTPRLAPCDFGERALVYQSMRELPPGVVTEISRYFGPGGGMADAGEYFQSTDVIRRATPRFRFARAYFVHDNWFIWFEAGGIGYSIRSITMSRKFAQPKTAYSITPGSHFTGNLCAAAKAYLAGAMSVGS